MRYKHLLNRTVSMRMSYACCAGVKKVHAEVKSLRTGWLVGAIRVKKALAALSACAGAGLAAGADSTTPSGTAVAESNATVPPPSLETCTESPSPRLYFSLANDRRNERLVRSLQPQPSTFIATT